MNHEDTFHFYTERRLVQLTGLTAHNLQELVSLLREVSGSCIFYHTHHLFLSHHFEKPVVYNDFAAWVADAIRVDALAEKLSAIDLMTFTSVRQLREAIIALIDDHLKSHKARECPPGQEFHFRKSKSFIMPTGVVAQDVPDFFAKMRGITNTSLYFHFLEARLRLERRTNDFSEWLRGRGEEDLARSVDALDPYVVTLDELKDQIVELGRRRGIS